MPSIVYTGSSTGSVALNAARTVDLSGGGTAQGIINSVVATLYFSTNAYSNYYNVTATLNWAGGSKASTRTVKMTASNYTGGAFDFTFDGLTVDQANSIESVTVTCSANADKIFIKSTQKVTVDYSIVSATSAPASLTLGTESAAPGAFVLLSWSGARAGENNPITAFHIFRSTNEYGPFNLYATVSTNSTSGSTFVSAPTGNGDTCYYAVQTIGTYSGFDGDMSDAVVELTCSFASVGAPTTVDLSNTNLAPGGTTEINWYGATAGENNAIAGYEVHRASHVDGPYTLLTRVTTASPSGSATVTAPDDNGAAYYYKVRTLGTLSGNDSDLSSAYAVLSCTYSTPSAPELTVNGGPSVYVYPGETVLLNWSGAADGANNAIVGYAIQRDGAAYADVGAGVTSYSVPAHDASGMLYAYTVRTKGSYSNSAPSSAVYVYSYTDPVAPEAVYVNNANPNAGARVVLSWSGAAGGGYNAIGGYRVYRSTEVNGVYTLVATVSSTQSYASCSVYAPATTGDVYYFRVETMGAHSGSGQSTSYAGVTAGEVADSDSETTVIVTPSKREKRGFILGDYDTAAEGWTLREWSFPEPEPVSSYVTVPGRSAGPLDMSTALTNGDPRYGSRPLTLRLECSDGTRLERDAIIDDMVNRLNGHRVEIISPDDRTRYAVGRLTVRKDYSDMAHASVTVTGTCEPWRYNKEQTVLEVEMLGDTRTVVLGNSGRRIISPEVSVTGYGATIRLLCGEYAWEMGEGTHHLSGFTLPQGNTLLTLTGTGVVAFAYREAIL